MKFNKWTVGLAAIGVVSLASAARADEQMSQVQTALSQTTLSGYVDTAAQWNPNTDYGPGLLNHTGPGTTTGVNWPGNVPKYSFAQNDGFSLNAVDIALDKPEDSSQWAAGYHIEMMYGSAAVGIPFGFSSSTAPSPGAIAATIRQAFIRLHTPISGSNGIDWQVGVFDSIIGYESNSDPLNPNYTRSYGYTIEPTTFTGILGTYKVNDELSLSAGIANDEFNNSFVPGNSFESQKCYMGSVSLTAPDSMGFLKGATLSGGVVHNNNSFFGATLPGQTTPAFRGPTTSLYVGATVPTPITQLKAGLSFDYLFQDNVNTGAPSTGADLWNIAGYATFQATDKLSFNLRAEYLDNASSSAAAPITLYPGNNAEEFTATVQYNLWANVITRGEFRWDHTEHNFGAVGEGFGASPSSTGGYTGPSRNNDFLLALNVIYQF
ncbi:MAG TPA: outer membrane beta-barrel protein [Alphaproteobacteria bacterium]|nr:outer membrane beta-barrel protein [Alphaproteobacteria bacterium]